MRHPASDSERPANAGKSLSSSRLTKQRLINALATEIHETAALIEGTEAPPPYKISPVLSESHLVTGIPPAHIATAATAVPHG